MPIVVKLIKWFWRTSCNCEKFSDGWIYRNIYAPPPLVQNSGLSSLYRPKTCPKQVSKELKYIKWTTQLAVKSALTLTFEHHLLIGCNPCTKFGIDQVKGSKEIEWTTRVV